MTTTLTLHDGTTLSYTDVELGAILARLQAQGQSYCLGASDVAHVRVGGSLLLMDVGWVSGRKLIESYQISSDLSFPFGLKFTLGQATYELDDALSGVGYVGTIPVTSLAQVYMAMFNSGAQTYLVQTNAVRSAGAFQTTPAELKTITAGQNITITSTDDELTITGDVQQTDLTAVNAAIAANATNIAANAAAIATKQDSLATGNPATAHVKLLDVGTSAIKALTATGGVSLTDATTHVEISGSSLQADIAAKADTSYVTTQLATKADTLLDNGGVGVPVLTATGQSKISRINVTPANNGLLSIANDASANVELDCSQLQSQLGAVQAVVENPSNGYYYLRTPANSSLIVANGTNTGSVAAFNSDGSSVLHGNVNILGTITNAGLQSLQTAVAGKQDLLNAQAPLSITNNVLEVDLTSVAPRFQAIAPLSNTLNLTSGQFELEVDLSSYATTASVNTGLALKQDALTPLGGSGNNLLNSQVPAGKLANIFGGSGIDVAAVWSPGQPDHGNIQISMQSPWWVAGQISSAGAVLSSKGRYSYTCVREATGIFVISFSANPHPDGTSYVISALTSSRLSFAYLVNVGVDDAAVTSTSFKLVVQLPQATEFNAPIWFSVIA